MKNARVVDSIMFRMVFIGLSVILAAVIFCFSAETAEKSGGRSTDITRAVIEKIVPNIESLPEKNVSDMVSSFDHLLRKATHFSIYGLLGVFISLSSLTFRCSFSKRLFSSLGICTLYALSDEFHQLFVDGRGAQITDVLIDSVGSLCGIAVVLLLTAFIISKKKAHV